jgi:hypothetical protein
MEYKIFAKFSLAMVVEVVMEVVAEAEVKPQPLQQIKLNKLRLQNKKLLK